MHAKINLPPIPHSCHIYAICARHSACTNEWMILISPTSFWILLSMQIISCLHVQYDPVVMCTKMRSCQICVTVLFSASFCTWIIRCLHVQYNPKGLLVIACMGKLLTQHFVSQKATYLSMNRSYKMNNSVTLAHCFKLFSTKWWRFLPLTQTNCKVFLTGCFKQSFSFLKGPTQLHLLQMQIDINLSWTQIRKIGKK